MPQTNPQSGANSSSSASNSSDDKTSSLPPKESSSADKTMIEKLAKKTSGLLRGDRRKRHKHPPGVIVMLERGEWTKAATRAKKYNGECKVWATIRKTTPGGSQANEDGSSRSGGGSSLLSLALQGSYSSIGTTNTAATATDSSVITASSNGSDEKDSDSSKANRPVSSIKCKAIHHACHRLRSIHSYRTRQPENNNSACGTRGNNGKSSPIATTPDEEDEWVEACKCILTLIEIHPEACGDRESRHGCLPLHLAAFAMCETPPPPSFYSSTSHSHSLHRRKLSLPPMNISNSSSKGSHIKSPIVSPSNSTQTPLARPKLKTRSISHGSSEISLGGISAMISAENVAGGIECKAGDFSSQHIEQAMMEREDELEEENERASSPTPPPESAKGSSPQSPSAVEKYTVISPSSAKATIPTAQNEMQKVADDAARQHYLKINPTRREHYSLRVLNALLDAFPKGVRVDSEGGRLPLHTAVAGKATAGVISTLIKAYPGAARQRTKDGYLPLHLAAYWGVSHPEVAPMLLRAYPDATLGRNRWERTPLEEALVMAGENGRPHQIELVRALRKHPDYWARPNVDMGGLMLSPSNKSAPGSHVKTRNRPSRAARELAAIEQEEGGKHLVDVDETITDMSSDGEDDNWGIIEGDGMPLLSNDEQDSKHGMLNRFSPKNLIHKTAPKNHHQAGVPPLPNRGARSNKLYTNPLHVNGVYGEHALDLFHLIKSFSWAAVISRLETHPTEATEIRPVTVRGGYGAKVNPLYAVCERNPPTDVVENLIEVCPDATSSRKVPGSQLPLHAACTWRASSGVVGFLLAAHPAGAKARDDFSNLPLHCACFSGADTDVVEALVCTYPRGVWARNGQGSTAADIVRRLRHPNRLELLHLLEKRSLDLMLKRRRKLHQGDKAEVELPVSAGDSFDGSKDSSDSQSGHDDDDAMKTIAKDESDDDEGDGMMWI